MLAFKKGWKILRVPNDFSGLSRPPASAGPDQYKVQGKLSHCTRCSKILTTFSYYNTVSCRRNILNVSRQVQTCPDMPFKTFKKPPNLDAVVTEAILNSPLLQRKRVVLEPSLDNYRGTYILGEVHNAQCSGKPIFFPVPVFTNFCISIIGSFKKLVKLLSLFLISCVFTKKTLANMEISLVVLPCHFIG